MAVPKLEEGISFHMSHGSRDSVETRLRYDRFCITCFFRAVFIPHLASDHVHILLRYHWIICSLDLCLESEILIMQIKHVLVEIQPISLT